MDWQLFIKLYVIGLPLFIVGDLLWLGVVAKSFYQNRLGHLLGDVNWLAVTIFYFIFLLGLTFFATYPAVTKGTIPTAVVMGALFGFFTYATYDLTNWATLRDWSATVVVIDVIWGSLLCAVVASAVVYLSKILL